MRHITIRWDAPRSIKQVRLMRGRDDYGLFQIYGSHPEFGANALLYIGRAGDLERKQSTSVTDFCQAISSSLRNTARKVDGEKNSVSELVVFIAKNIRVNAIGGGQNMIGYNWYAMPQPF